MRHTLLLAASLFGLSASAALAQQTSVFYVAPNGSDAGAGTLRAPFATVARAQQAVRGLKRRGPVTVSLRGGTYFLARPLTFTSDDSGTASAPVTYAAYPRETPVISGGRPVTGWRRVSGTLWRAPAPAGLGNFRSLRVDDTDAVRARTPNFDPAHPHTGGWWFSQWSGLPWEKGGFGQAVGNAQAVGTKLSWDVTVPAGGAYTVWLRYAQAMRAPMGGNTTLRVGDAAPVALNDLPDTGDWSTFRWGKVAALALPAGAQTLTWENVKGGGLNLDAFVLTDDPAWTPNAAAEDVLPAAANGRHRLLIQAEAASKVVGEASVPKDAEGGPYDRIGVSPAQLAAVKNWAGAEVNIFPAWGWVNARLAVKSVDAERHFLSVDAHEQIWQNNRFYVENVREALDSPGEWFRDAKAGELLYQARGAEVPKTAVAPVMDRLLTLAGDPKTGRYVENIRFRGLTFSDTDYTLGGYYDQADSALWLTMARHCAVENCRFAHLGGYAVRLEQRSHANRIVRCTMANLGGGGVILLGNTATQPTDNVIAANDIHDCGRFYAHVAGVYVTTGSGNRISNNRIVRMPRYAVSLKSYDSKAYSHNNTVEYNDLEDTNLETNDTGAIETLGRDNADSGNEIRFNLIRNVVGLKVTTDGVLHTPFFTWGIYLDDFSSGTRVEGNVVDGTVVGAVCIHNGRNNVVQNNIFLNGSEMNIRLQPHGDDFMHNNVFRRNIVAYRDPKAILWYSYQGTWNRNILGEVDHNVYWHTGGLNLATTPQPITPEGPWAQWRAAGLDVHSVIADPQLTAPGRGDYRLKPTSPALKLGFQPIPLDRIGPAGYRP